ncbi:bifunctional aspartate kinase/homoserine dehydrogenase I [Luteimonas sp. 3794]|uniref:bifunctional aspartate kinase/homoserine dehydrogenase I n=1 Tax=Luteimonas sp. 3794 TaxID=2817730 RepID=UPI002855BF53|nr:bifunctional aspartate kinase/homoserine dehydrogenase I [Luteimonas sp. 3794]MDR6992195.1 aspartokinase/homoserine dehydrogenase 1 [Luteimonas sp. 3794]
MSAVPSNPLSRLQLHKFGGTSLADAGRIAAAARLAAPVADGASVVVVSAMRGVTDALVALAAVARGGGDWAPGWQALQARHHEAAHAIPGADTGTLIARLDAEAAALHADLGALAFATEDAALRVSERIWGHGELCSAWLMHAALGGEPAGWARLDAREVLVVHGSEIGMHVDREASLRCLAGWRARHPQAHVVATGFVARTPDGHATTLGRNGSDHSATLLADLFDADAVTIWTDVDGVLSADPRLVPDAVCLSALSYAEACELAYFGAKVLHPRTIVPLQARGIPLSIRNALAPSTRGTRIDALGEAARSPVKGLSIVDDMAVLELTGSGMAGVPGVAETLFAALHATGVSVTMISQGSSEHSICCVVRAPEAARGRAAIENAFADAIAGGQVEGVRLETGLCVLAAVGDGMVGSQGVAARLFDGLAQARVNIRAIAQGASERNISVAIAQDDATRALRAAHAAFWLSPQTVSVGVIGPGNVGRALLAQLSEVIPALRARAGVDLRLRAIASSRRMYLSDAALDPDTAGALLGDHADACDLDAFAAHVRADHLPHAMIVDCSASDAVAAKYEDWLAAGIHVVTPNKHAGSGDWTRYARIAEARVTGHSRFMYEATVGAGLPVIVTLRNLLDTGDTLHAIDGMLSGTLAWLFNSFDGSRPFSELVREARALGYTEPDPRDDLSGLDVARKLVILAREAGRTLSLADVDVESLVPEALREVPLDEFLQRLSELDAPMQARLDAARAQGRGLRHIARLEAGGDASVGVRALPADHACMHTRLTDNLVQFTTARYAENPLVVQGPGAGPQVTAAGVFGDVLAIAHALGARTGWRHA